MAQCLVDLRKIHYDFTRQNAGLDGRTAVVHDMALLGIWDPLVVKSNCVRSALECVMILLRTDSVISQQEVARK